MPIQNISDTARWVAVYRAMESARPDAIFHDPFAARLAGPAGFQIVNELKRGKSLAWPMIVRTAVFDEMIVDRVTNSAVDTIINLAAGLDTRPWRMRELPASLHWVDVDLPGITNYKANAMSDERPVCNYEAIAVDLTDTSARSALFAQALFAQPDAHGPTALVITEGLLIYLTAQQVAALASDLHSIQFVRWWLIDLASPRLLQIIKRHWGGAAVAGAAPFQFAPADGSAFFANFGWREREFRSGLEEAHRLHREMRLAPLWRLLGKLGPAAKREEFRRMSGYVMLERRS